MKRLNFFLLLALLLSIAANLNIRDYPALPNREFMPEMVRTVRFNAFSPNPNFPDGKTLQPPVPGTIAQGVQPIHYEATPAGALLAGEELRNPFTAPAPAAPAPAAPAPAAPAPAAPAPAAAALDRGAIVFQTFCTPCHGGSAKGDGAVVLRGYPAPPSLLADKAAHLKDGQIFHILTFGRKNMPSYASQLSQEDRWKVILYVRSIQQSAPPAAPPQAVRP